MSAQIVWRHGMKSLHPQVTGRLPRKPVIWFGEIFLRMPDGEKDTRAWRSNQPMTTEQARTVLNQLLKSLINEHGKDEPIDSGFWCRSR